MVWRGSSTVENRLFVCLVYSLPIAAGASFGIFLYQQLPVLGNFIYLLLSPFLFIDSLINRIPYGGFIVFFALLLLVVRNDEIRHFVRFNTMQAILIMIAADLCSLVLSLLGIGLEGLSLTSVSGLLVGALFTTIFLGAIGASLYSILQSIRGLYPEIPFISDAAYSQVSGGCCGK